MRARTHAAAATAAAAAAATAATAAAMLVARHADDPPPPRRGHRTEYEAPPETRARWERMDPTNALNPGVGGLSYDANYGKRTSAQ